MSEALITKKAIAQGLKDLTLAKPFGKISIGDITSACGLNRQTFYYHFQDKYELLSWIYYNEGFIYVMDGITLENWHEKLKDLLDTMKADQEFYRNTIKNDDSYFKEYLLEIVFTLFYEAIDKLDEDKSLSDEDKKFYSQFYAYGICGVVVSWVESGMKEDTKKLSDKLKGLAQGLSLIHICPQSETAGAPKPGEEPEYLPPGYSLFSQLDKRSLLHYNEPVSYTHLDVYKRQPEGCPQWRSP